MNFRIRSIYYHGIGDMMNQLNLDRDFAPGMDQRLEPGYMAVGIDSGRRQFDNTAVYRTHAGSFYIKNRKRSQFIPLHGQLFAVTVGVTLFPLPCRFDNRLGVFEFRLPFKHLSCPVGAGDESGGIAGAPRSDFHLKVASGDFSGAFDNFAYTETIAGT